MRQDSKKLRWTRPLEIGFLIAALVASVVIAGKLFFNLPVLSSRTLDNGDEIQAIAHIRSKNRSVRRRPDSIPVWNTAQTSESLHLNDQIFTDEDSSAQIEFTDKTVLDVSEKTLLIMRRVENKNTINLKQGSVFARFQEPGSLVLEVNNSTYVISSKEKSQIQINTNATGELALEVVGGRVRIDGKNGQAELVSDQRVTVNSQQQISEVTQAPLLLLSPDMDAFIRISKVSEGKIKFSWVGETQDTYRFQMARDQNFQKQIVNISTTVPSHEIENLEPGSYFWRVSAKDSEDQLLTSATRAFQVADETAPVLISPRRGETFSGGSGSRKVYFDWLKNNTAISYLMELANDQGFENSQVYTVTDKPFLSPELRPGIYFWRVKFVADGWQSAWSLVFSFQIGQPATGLPSEVPTTTVSSPQELDLAEEAFPEEAMALPEESPLALQEAVIEKPDPKSEVPKDFASSSSAKSEQQKITTYPELPKYLNPPQESPEPPAKGVYRSYSLPSESVRFVLGITPTWLETVNRDRVNREYVRSFVLQAGFARADIWIQESWGFSGQTRFLRTSLFRKKSIAALPVNLNDYDFGLNYKFRFRSSSEMALAVGMTYSQRDLLSITRSVDDQVDQRTRSLRGAALNANFLRALSENLWTEIYAEYFAGQHADLKKRKMHVSAQGKMLYRWSKNWSLGAFYSLDYAKYQFKTQEDRLGKIENYGTRRQSLGLLLGWSW